MQDDRLAEFRTQIASEIAACIEDIASLEKSAAPVKPDSSLGRLTRMDSLNDQGIGVAALSKKREKLYNLEQALERLKQPGFGICIMCKNPIPVERLMALPETTRCVPCASR